MSVLARRKDMGYEMAQARKRCATCANSRREAKPQSANDVTYCVPGAFYTTAWSVCQQWQERAA